MKRLFIVIVVALILLPSMAHAAWPHSEGTCSTFASQDTDSERHSENTTANRTDVADGVSFIDWSAGGSKVTGNFTGTTHQIIRWSACKWLGTTNTIVKRWAAQLSVESSHVQSSVGCNGDCFGLGQLRRSTWPQAFPRAQQSTAFNVDAAAMYLRACLLDKFEGWDGVGEYSNLDGADLWWHCVGIYFAGERPTEGNGGNQYIRDVKARMSNPDVTTIIP